MRQQLPWTCTGRSIRGTSETMGELLTVGRGTLLEESLEVSITLVSGLFEGFW